MRRGTSKRMVDATNKRAYRWTLVIGTLFTLVLIAAGTASLFTDDRYSSAFQNARSDELLTAFNAHAAAVVHFNGTIGQSAIIDRKDWTFIHPYGSARNVPVMLSMKHGRLRVCQGDRVSVNAAIRRVRNAIEAVAARDTDVS